MAQSFPTDQATQLLSQLRDIHPADPAGWWPLAPGWWIVMVLVILALAWLTLSIIKRIKAKAWRKYALMELENLKQRFQQAIKNQESEQAQVEMRETIAQLNQLLRRICYHTSHRTSQERASQVGARTETSAFSNPLTLSPAEWKSYLRQAIPSLTEQDLNALAQQHYARVEIDLSPATFGLIRQWVKKQ